MKIRGKRAKRARRRNADDGLRRLERAAHRPGAEPADIAKYWLACLRAGVLPNYTLVEQYSDGAPYGVWMLEPAKGPHDLEVPSIRDAVHSVYYKEGDPRYYGWRVSDFYGGGYHSHEEEDVKTWLRLMMSKYGIEEARTQTNPRTKRRNADDSIRKLERRAQSGEAADIAAYWYACLRAKQDPVHTTTYSHLADSRKIWTLFPEEYHAVIEEHYTGDFEARLPSRAIAGADGSDSGINILGGERMSVQEACRILLDSWETGHGSHDPELGS